MARRYNNRQPSERETFNPDWSGYMEALLDHEGSLDDTYRRLYNYSMGNCAFLLYQGVPPQPIATYDRWKELGRQVKRGAKARSIIRPVNIKLKDQLDEEGNPLIIKRFKPVRCIFPIEDTEGEDLPPVQIPEWDKDTALKNLDITEVPYEMFDNQVQGYSYGKNVAINPTAKRPFKTLMHELGHVVLGHTTEDEQEDYQHHAGEKEFQAEATAVITLKELRAEEHMDLSVSAAYVKSHMHRERPSDRAIQGVFKGSNQILEAGRPAGGE